MILQPLGDNIVLELPELEKEKTTESGIFIPVTGTEQSLRKEIAKVAAVGEGRRLNTGEVLTPRVKENDEVLYNKYAGTELLIEDKKYLVIKESDILAVIKR